MHFAQIRLVLERGGAAEAHRVAEVVHDGAAHNGVEVDYRDSLSRGCVQQHVVELGIVVRHSFGNLAATEHIYDFRGEVVVARHERDFVLAVRLSPCLVRFRRGDKVAITRYRVVKIGDNVADFVHVEAVEHARELAERRAALVKVLVAAREVERNGVVDVQVHAPAAAVRAQVRLAVRRGDKRHRFAVGVAALCRDVLLRVGEHLDDVAHKRVDVAENRVVDALKNILFVVGFDEVSVVDVPVAVGTNGLSRAADGKALNQYFQLFFVHNLS